jgi:hypothetical protein
MPIVGRKVADEEPIGSDGRTWARWALGQIRTAVAAGADLPKFRQQNPWAYWLLATEVDKDASLSRQVDVDVRACKLILRRKRRRR